MRTHPGHPMGVYGAFSTLVTIMVVVLHSMCFVTACNIDVGDESLLVFTIDDPGSYFGYTTVQHTNSDSPTPMILVGAPRGRSRFQPMLERPGALYQCDALGLYACQEVDLDRTGNEIVPSDNIADVKDNQWLGVSLTRQTHNEKMGDFAVCGHLWSNDHFINEEPDSEILDRFPNGICYVSDANFATVRKIRPCTDEMQVNGTYRYHGSCQAGISAVYAMNGDLILGAVGSYDWNGTIIKEETDTYRYNIADLSDWQLGRQGETEYVGYSVSTGNFMSASTEQGVTGAPRSDSVGKVFIYDLDTFGIYTELRGVKFGAYFGSAVLGVDLNNDGLSDLLVGAPLYSVDQDEGRVYVYLNRGEGKMEPLAFMLDGSNAIGGRFGSTIAFIGDINLDGFDDIAIAAPYEEENTGAVYIYRGYTGGIRRTYSQRIAAKDRFPGILSFGSSISGGTDVDFNRYPDIVVGSYANDTVYLFRTLPVVKLKVWIEVEPKTLDPEHSICDLGGRMITCLEVSACFDYTADFGLPDQIKFNYNLHVDVLKTEIGATSRFFFLGDGGEKVTAVAETITLLGSDVSCFPRQVYLKSEAADFLTPLKFLLNFNIFDYPYEEPPRGDAVYKYFEGGVVPVLDNEFCSNGTADKMVLFVRDCGTDSLCQTNIQVTADLRAQSANSYVTLGGDSVVYLEIEVQNQGEEAHQTELLITHAREVVYESLELQMVECLDSITCTSDTMVTCSPREAYNETAEVLCSVGNPMRSRTASILRIRFDIGGMAWSRSIVDFTVAATTLSIDENLQDNTFTAALPVRIVADITVIGVVKPQPQVFYSPDNETIGGVAPDKVDLTRKALEAAGILAAGGGSLSTKAIGPSFKHIYEVSNQGPGRLPFDTSVSIELPWKTMNGDWLIYIRDIQLSGEGSCDTSAILQQQRDELAEHYLDQSGNLVYSVDGMPLDSIFGSTNRDIDCDKASCVTISCTVKESLVSGSGVFVTIDALLWQRTLIDNEMGAVDLVSMASVKLLDPTKPHTQPDDELPDTIQLKTMIFTDDVPDKPVEPWVIAISTIAGILGLILLVAALWKLGFFERNMHEEATGNGNEPVAL